MPEHIGNGLQKSIMNPTIIYKQNNLEDLERIFEISNIIFKPTAEEKDIHQNERDWVKKVENGGPMITVFGNDNPVGFAICHKKDNRTLHIWNAGVLPQFRKQGI